MIYSLRQDTSGLHVRGLQVALNKRSAGLLLDDAFGPVTNTAVRNFQNVNQLVVEATPARSPGRHWSTDLASGP